MATASLLHISFVLAIPLFSIAIGEEAACLLAHIPWNRLELFSLSTAKVVLESKRKINELKLDIRLTV